MKFQLLFFLLCFSIIISAQNLTDYEVFKFSPNKDTTLITNLGTKISIPQNSFKFISDTTIVVNTITLKVKEIVNQDDMILEGISTQTDEGILTSNGMILIEGYSNNSKLEIKENESINITMPSSSGLTNMDIYIMDDSTQNWEKSNNRVKFDTCSTYKQQVLTRSKTVSKKRYKEWKKEQVELGKYEEPLFGGKTITIGRRANKSYNILVPIDTIWVCENYDMSYYSFSINSFGWYNIDKVRYVRNPIKLVVFTEEDLDIFLLLSNENICIRASKTRNGKYKFGRIPRGKNAQIVGYKQNNHETVNVVMQDVYLSKGEIKLKPSKKMTIGEFKRIMKVNK